MIRELDKVQTPRSNVSARAFDSYAQARPEYIAPDYQAGKGYERLARSLSSFNKEITSAYDDYTKRKRAEEHAMALIAYDQYNGKDIDELVKTNPEVAEQVKKYYYFKEGYEKAHANSLGLAKAKFMQDEYTRSGLQNETDIQRVVEWANKTSAEWDKQYSEDLAKLHPEIVAEAYAPYAEKAKTGLLNRHTQDMAASWEARMVAEQVSKYTALVETLVPGLSNGNISDEDVEILSVILDNMCAEMRSGGVREDNILDERAKIVFSWYAAYGEDADILDTLNVPERGSSVIPKHVPWVAERINALEEAAADKARRLYIQNMQIENLQRKEAVRAFEDTVASALLANSKTGIFMDTVLDKSGNTLESFVKQGTISPSMAFDLIDKSNSFQRIMQTSLEVSPEASALGTWYAARALSGDLRDFEEAQNLAITYGNNKIIENFVKGEKTKNEEDLKLMKEKQRLIRKDILSNDFGENMVDENGRITQTGLLVLRTEELFMEGFNQALRDAEETKGRPLNKFEKTFIADDVYNQLIRYRAGVAETENKGGMQ